MATTAQSNGARSSDAQSDGQPAGAEQVPLRERLVNARLARLLWFVRVAGDMAYRRQIGLTEMQRRLVTLLGHFGGLSSAELVGLTGSDKAQISRAVKALTDAGMISRQGLRSRIQLSANGSALFGQIMVLAGAADASLSRGIGKMEMKRFAAATELLTARAAQLLALERQLSVDEGEDAADSPYESGRFADKGGPPPGLVVPALLGLASYLERSAAVAYKRETGISRFEWQVLAQVADFQPISLAKLIIFTGRDKSHVGRTLKRLAEGGLVTQKRVQGKRETILTTTGEGWATYEAMCSIAIRRDDFLFAEAPEGTKAGYLVTIDKLTANAEARYNEEKARADEEEGAES